MRQRVRPYSGSELGHSKDQSQAVERTSVRVQCGIESGPSDNWIQGEDEGQALARRRVCHSEDKSQALERQGVRHSEAKCPP